MTHPEVLDEQNVLLRLDNLEAEQRKLDALVSGWARGSATDPYFDHLYANTGIFYKSPIEGGQVQRLTTQNIVSDTDTAIIWTSQHLNNEDYISWSSVSNSTRIYIKTPGITEERGILVVAYAAWQGDSTVGQRELRMVTHRADATTIGALRDINTANAFVNSGVENSISVVYRPNSSHAFVTFEVRHDVGSDIDLFHARAALIRIF